MCKSIVEDNRTWAQLKSKFQEAYLDREYLKQTAGAARYGTAHNVKSGDMEDYFMNFVSDTEARDASFTEIITTHGNLYTQLRQQEYQIRALQAKLFNLKVAAAT